jgi:ubiquinone/menaquinone biosynthesis C-methylase UbiE
MNCEYAPPLTDEEYAVAFAAFRKNTNHRQLMLDWFMRRTSVLMNNHSACSVLSIGCGNGDFDLAVIQNLVLSVQELRYVALDPNTVMLDTFREQVQLTRLPNVKLELLSCSFEQMDISEPNQFDLVHFTHCLYFIDDRLDAILRASHLLKQSGAVLILNSMIAGIQDIRLRFTKRALGTQFAPFTGEQLQEILCGAKVAHEFDLLNGVTEITECFDGDSQVGNLLLNFFLDCDTKCLASELKSEILDHLCNISYRDSDRIFMPHPVAAVQVRPEALRWCKNQPTKV